MTSEGLRVHVTDDGTRASITFGFSKGNLVTGDVIRAIDAALDELAPLPHLRLVTIEGAGPHFSFGASVQEHAPGEIERVLPEANELIEKLLAFPAPTAALVRGRCLGGGFEIALACDFVFAEASASFGLPEIALGVFPPAACALLPARVGLARATRAILTGGASSADEWRQAGLVTAVSADGELAADLERWFAEHLAGRSAEALRHAAAAARFALRRDVRAVLPELERLYLDVLMKTADAREGIAAFLGKRPPVWTDR